MIRRKSNKGNSLLDDLFDLLFNIIKSFPWWVNFLLAIFSYSSLHYLSNKYSAVDLQGINFGIAIFAYICQYVFPIIFILGGIVSLWNVFRGKELLWSVSSGGTTEALAKMSWQNFELLMGQWFKTQGYDVVQAGGAHADGGVDIELRKNNELYLVQCKHYRAWKVPVETIRDLYGVMTSRGAVGGFVVTSGRFTQPAKEFAEGRVINLIDGEKLTQILKQSNISKLEPQSITANSKPLCPKCNSNMERRTARHGMYTGHDFWGCIRYPACRGTAPIN